MTPEEYEILRKAITVSPEKWDLYGASLFTGTNLESFDNILQVGIKNVGRGHGGACAYFAIGKDIGIAEDFAVSRAKERGGSPIIAEAVVGTKSELPNLRIARFSLHVSHGDRICFEKGILPKTWPEIPELQAFFHKNFDVLEIRNIQLIGLDSDENRMLCVHESANTKLVQWKALRLPIPASRAFHIKIHPIVATIDNSIYPNASRRELAKIAGLGSFPPETVQDIPRPSTYLDKPPGRRFRQFTLSNRTLPIIRARIRPDYLSSSSVLPLQKLQPPPKRLALNFTNGIRKIAPNHFEIDPRTIQVLSTETNRLPRISLKKFAGTVSRSALISLSLIAEGVDSYRKRRSNHTL